MRKLIGVTSVFLLLWLAFEVGREVERQQVADSGRNPELVDTAVREIWRTRTGPAGPIGSLDTGRLLSGPAMAIDTEPTTVRQITPSETLVAESCGVGCGVRRWEVKTLSDQDRGLVQLTPVDASIEQLGSIPRPRLIPSAGRVQPYETTVYRVRGYLAAVSDQSDGDVHLVVFDTLNQRASLIAEIPNPQCSGACRSGFAGRFAAARDSMTAGLRRVAESGADDPILLEIIGVGFFDYWHGQNGAAPNLFELHPVLAIRFNR